VRDYGAGVPLVLPMRWLASGPGVWQSEHSGTQEFLCLDVGSTIARSNMTIDLVKSGEVRGWLRQTVTSLAAVTFRTGKRNSWR